MAPAYASRTFFNITDSLSISFWAKPNPAIQNSVLVGNGESGANGIGVTLCAFSPINTVGNKIVLYEGGTGYMQGPYTTDTSWKHIVFTYKMGIYKYYVNDTLRSSGDSIQFAPTNSFNVGAVKNGSTITNYFSGALDDVRVYHRILGAAQVDSLFHEVPTLAVPQTNIVNSFSVYPNPANSTIQIESKITITKIKIINLAGQTIIDNHYNTTNAVINIKDLSPGVYFIQINNLYTQKLVKE